MKRIYLDYAATTPIDPKVYKAMKPYLNMKKEMYGNPGSLHYFGQTTLAAVDRGREKIAETISANRDEIIFTGCATEANNLTVRGIIKSFYRKYGSDRKPKIITSSIEHPSITNTFKDVEKDGLANVYFLKVGKSGVVDVNELKKELDNDTILVSVMWVNNETGAIQPIKEIAKAIEEFRSNHHSPTTNYYPLFHTDASQAFRVIDLNVTRSGADLMTISSHKIYGPKGIGALFIKKNVIHEGLISAVETGGDHEFGLRSGTENVPFIVGFAKAAEICYSNLGEENKKLKEFSEYLFNSLKSKFSKVEINSSPENRAPHILNLYLPFIENAGIALDVAGVAVTMGSACSQRRFKLSKVLTAMGYEDERIKHSVRFSFGKFLKKSDIDETIKRIIILSKKSSPDSNLSGLWCPTEK
jgi:cysteine desulfurase